ncbi:MAG: hypothetical protein Q9183_006071, partial [Haloplaca sp. 2 TL-2023]
MAPTKCFTLIALLAASVHAAPPYEPVVTQIPDGQVQVQWKPQSISTPPVRSQRPSSSSSSLPPDAATVVGTINSQVVTETFIPSTLPQYSSIPKTTVTSLDSRQSPMTLVVESGLAWVPLSQDGNGPQLPAPTTAPTALDSSTVSAQGQDSGTIDLNSTMVSRSDGSSEASTTSGATVDGILPSTSQEPTSTSSSQWYDEILATSIPYNTEYHELTAKAPTRAKEQTSTPNNPDIPTTTPVVSPTSGPSVSGTKPTTSTNLGVGSSQIQSSVSEPGLNPTGDNNAGSQSSSGLLESSSSSQLQDVPITSPANLDPANQPTSAQAVPGVSDIPDGNPASQQTEPSGVFPLPANQEPEPTTTPAIVPPDGDPAPQPTIPPGVFPPDKAQTVITEGSITATFTKEVYPNYSQLQGPTIITTSATFTGVDEIP